jgi:hypothetical protein
VLHNFLCLLPVETELGTVYSRWLGTLRTLDERVILARFYAATAIAITRGLM